MAALIHLAKKALFRMPAHPPPPPTSWRAPFSFSNAAQGTNAVAGGRNLTSVLPKTTRDTENEAMEKAEAVGDTVMEAMDSAYDVTEKSTQDVKDTIVAEADNHVVDTSEYRSIQDAAKQTETSKN